MIRGAPFSSSSTAPLTANLTTRQVNRCLLCNKPIHRSTQPGVWSCIRLHHWVECPVHSARWAFWSGDRANQAFQSSAAQRQCQCHRDDPQARSEYVLVEWYHMSLVDGQKRYGSLHGTEVLPRPLLTTQATAPSETLAPRTRTAPGDAAETHILVNQETFKNSIFASLHPSWTLSKARGHVLQWHVWYGDEA